MYTYMYILLAGIIELFADTNTYLRLCWLRAVGGAWTTTSRMHEAIVWLCVFGCVDAKEGFRNIIQCAILWQIVRLVLMFRRAISR